ncbi:MAG TPA: tetratricopeptide repeat protein, partial [Kofleriaceae bacterium]|nr:tetratricopeptide repeat protein [Kofleriaceae bacterium]
VLAIVAVIAAVKVTRAGELADTAFERGQRKLCASEAPALQSPWTAEARDLVHRQFATTKLPYVPQTLARVDQRFEQWSAELATARELACAGTRPDLDRVLECLADDTREARALISQFHDADQATVVNAVSATERLAPATTCTERAFAPNVTVADPARATAVRDSFARSHALFDLAKYRAGKEVAINSVALATALGDPGLLASALVSRGQAELDLSDFTAAQATLEQALRLAETAQNDRARAQAWTNLIRIAYLRGHYDRVLELKDAALGATERVGDRWLQSEIMLNVGGALTQQNKLAEAEALFAQAVAMRRVLYGDRDRRLAFALSALGNAYAMEGKLDAGITAHRDALVTAEADLGADHPDVAVLHGNLADDYIYGLRAADAVTELERDVAITATANGARDLAMALTDLGTARLEAGQHAAAIEAFDRADASWRAVNANHPARADVLLGRYLARRALGQPAELADLETANKLAAGLPPFMHARVQFALGTATHDPKLVAAAAAGYATSSLPLCQRDLASAQAWLAANH